MAGATDDAANEVPKGDARRWLNALHARHRGPVNRAVAAGIFAGLFSIAQMGLLAWVIYAAIVAKAPASALLPWFGGLLVALLGRAVAQGLQTHYAALSSYRIRAEVRDRLMHGWAALGPVRLQETSAATLAREWLEHVDALHGYVARFLPQMILCIVVPLLVLTVVAWQDWLAALFLLLSAPIIPLFMALIGMGAEKLNRDQLEMVGRLSGQFLDRVRGLTTLQLFGQADAAVETIERSSHQYRELTMKTLKVAFLSSAVLEFFASVAIAVVAMYVGFGLLGYIAFGPAPELTLFSGLFILLLAPEFFQPLRQLSQHYHDRAAALAAASRLLQRLHTAPVMPTGPAPDALQAANPAPEGSLRLSAVDVVFPDGRQGLQRIDLDIDKGQSVALTGASGGGKSTLLHLLAGFIPPTHGKVTVFGETPGSRPFGWLGQTAFMVEGSWADNLRLAVPAANDGDIETALRRVGLGPVLDARPAGIHSRVTEEGSGLSGGQARRLSLARVFLMDTDLVLLDEPTAGLDRATELVLINALKDLHHQGKTLVFATHHDTLLGLADRVLVVADGQVTDA
ncbi:thiol reductant ABC exporter subunit CydD [Marinobacter caseinilyticus]|uniref:thiol reductant ABC exporter subunit CydD n=1 Tax=Marinobacter caseinilyticus TaxID=2692195 RepID=UPI00140E0634|nr:thiol reductant ABC exporter subunit CydD [Marinobacter caseinilyticus]